MKVTITPQKLNGEVRAIASKSQAHRLLICAGLAEGETKILCREKSADIDATAECLRALGCGISYGDGIYTVSPAPKTVENALLDCGESGSTLRFILPVACALGRGAVIKMRGRLSERPLSPLWEELESQGCTLSKPHGDEIAVSGRLRGGRFRIAGNVSSQFISGLMFALPLCGGGEIEIEGDLESEGYVDMTRAALESFGVKIRFDGRIFYVPGAHYVSPGALEVEGDWSNGAFWLSAEALGNTVSCSGLDEKSAQRDKKVTALLEEIVSGGAVIDARDIPDLVPVLSAVAAVSGGETRFINAQRLRIKESDRIFSTLQMLEGLGADACEKEDGIKVRGSAGKLLSGGRVSSFNDHRIAMSAAILSTVCGGEVIIEDAQAVSKSYPAFWEDFERLGGRIKREE